MEFCSQVKLDSSWKTSTALDSVLYIRKSSEHSSDQQSLHYEEDHVIQLHRPPQSSDPCYIYIDVSDINGYITSSVQVISTSRTLECYNGRNEEYITTNRGTLVKQMDNSGSKLYKCVIESCDIKPQFTLKLASLYNQHTSFIAVICLIVTENTRGGESERSEELTTSKTKPNDIQQLLSDASTSERPLLPQLLVTLQQLQHAQSTTKTEMDQMMSFFRQMRPNVTKNEQKEEETVSISSKDDSTVMIEEEDSKENLLERKLKEYIDIKIAALEESIECKIQDIYDKMETRYKEMYNELITITK